MLAKVYTMGIRGARGYPVAVELDASNGLPAFVTVGLPGSALKESKERVVSAVRNSGYRFPRRRVTVNLAPAQSRKEGTHFDLPIALAALLASGQVPAGEWSATYFFAGELALDGALRPVPGVLAMCLEARASGFEAAVVPCANAEEAEASGMKVLPVSSLREAADLLGGDGAGEGPRQPGPTGPPPRCWKGLSRPIFWKGTGRAEPLIETPGRSGKLWNGDESLCFSDVKGQGAAKRALEIAAAGGHNLLMIGPPGVGKSMLAKRLPGILPEPTPGEALEIARIRSLAGLGGPAAGQRPFRAPHHSATVPALAGGGAMARPGEAAFAHGGVLFLDELAEFSRESLEVLRQPLEDGRITVTRLQEVIEYPARFMLIAATNPCPCGYRGHPGRECSCAPGAVLRYLSRLSGPLMDRIDLQLELGPIDFAEWARVMPAPVPSVRERPSGRAAVSVPLAETSAQVRERVVQARKIQSERFSRADFAHNSFIPHRELGTHCPLDEDGLAMMRSASEKLHLSARSLDRALRVARTVADLAGSAAVAAGHLAEALQYRRLDRIMNQDRREVTWR